MQFDVAKDYDSDGDALILRVAQDTGKLPVSTKEVDTRTGGAISKLVRAHRFKGRIGETRVFRLAAGGLAPNVILVGVGTEPVSVDQVRRAMAEGIRKARGERMTRISTPLSGVTKLPVQTMAQACAEGSTLADYRFDRYQKSDEGCLEIVLTFVADKREHAAIRRGIARGETITQAVVDARDLVNEPPSRLTPAKLADAAKAMAKASGLRARVVGPTEMERLGFEPTLAVARGSQEEPRFITVEYRPSRAKCHIVLVGKGITYDSGGISLKPSKGGSLEHMKMDMAGAAAVLGAISALPKLKLPVRVTALVAATENMPSGASYKPGDVVRAYNGKTIEVLNTDAEGRLTLADVLSYAEDKLEPDILIDLATLTSTEVSLGTDYAATFGDDELAEKLHQAGETTGEKNWQLPLPDEYQDTVKSTIADVRNIGTDRGYSINGAVFLKNFVERTPWLHIDIGDPAMSERERHYLPKGGTGFGVRLLIEYLLRLGVSHDVVAGNDDV